MDFLRNVFNVGDSQNAYHHVYGGVHHKSSFTHELIAGAAGFAAMKAYEDHCRRNGQNVSHPFMKELLAGFAAAEADKLFETHGLDFLDRERAKRHAIQQAHHLAEQQYGPGGVFNYQANQYGNYPPNFQQQGGYGMDPYNGGNYPPQGGYGMNPYNNGSYPPQGGYPMNPYNNGSYPPQGGYAMNPYNDPNYQQQGNKHHHHHHHHIF